MHVHTHIFVIFCEALLPNFARIYLIPMQAVRRSELIFFLI